MKHLHRYLLAIATISLVIFSGCSRKQESRSVDSEPRKQAVIPGKDTAAINKEDIPELEGKIIVVDYFATWCAPCRELSPYFERWANTYRDDVDFRKVDVDENQMLAEENDIEAMPTVIVYSPDTIEVARIVGFDPKRIEAAIKKAIDDRKQQQTVSL